MKYYIIFLILNQIFFVLSPIPNWNIGAQSIDLLSSTSSYDLPIYSKNSYGITVTLKKTITKESNGISVKNYLTVVSNTTTTIEVDFDGIDSHYTSKIGCDIVICPTGKFHPYDFKNRKFLKPNTFVEEGTWDLRCYDHFSGYFLIFYLKKNANNFFYSYNNAENIVELGYINSYFYDFKLQNRDNNQAYNYEYLFPLLQYEKDYNNLKLYGCCLILNFQDKKVEKNTFATKWLVSAKNYVKGSFDSNHKFYYLNYNSISDFESGYSTGYVDFSSKEIYINACNNIGLSQTTTSPLTFADNVEIEDINFISGTSYAYYKIYNSDKDKTYYGLINVKGNKVIYNFDENISSFIPISSSEILAITSTSAYKVCIIKSGSSCSDSCSSGNLILDAGGNKCQSGCDSGKIKFMPEEICMAKSLCDTNYYTLNSDETQCGLCSYFDPSGNKYKLVNTTGCLSSRPANTESYNNDESLGLLKCITNYHLNDNSECVPDSCFGRCATCSEIGTSETDQKCSTCKPGYTLEEGNCIVPPTTIIIPPTTVLPPTTITIPPTTVIIPPTTVTIPPTTVTIPPTTVTIPPTTVTPPPTTITIPPTTIITPPTTVTIPPTTILPPPTTEIIPPTTILPPPTTIITEAPTEGEILETCTNKRCQTCNEESDEDGLCLSCDENKYKKVNYTNKYSKYNIIIIKLHKFYIYYYILIFI